MPSPEISASPIRCPTCSAPIPAPPPGALQRESRQSCSYCGTLLPAAAPTLPAAPSLARQFAELPRALPPEPVRRRGGGLGLVVVLLLFLAFTVTFCTARIEPPPQPATPEQAAPAELPRGR